MNDASTKASNRIRPFAVALYGSHRDHYDWAEGECIDFEDVVWRADPLTRGGSGE